MAIPIFLLLSLLSPQALTASPTLFTARPRALIYGFPLDDAREGCLFSVYYVFSDNGTLRILPIDEANETKVIKANNGVLLACDNGVGGNAYEIVANPGGQKSGTVPATTDAASYAGNAMVPVIQATNYAAGDFYILKNNVFHTIAGNASKVPACKAVFSVAKGNR